MELDPAQAVHELVACPYGQTLGVSVADVGVGWARLRIDHRDENANRNGTMHGGVIASLVHMAGLAAVRASLGEPEAAPQADPGWPTQPWRGEDMEITVVDLSIHFIAAPGKEAAIADGKVVRRGREIIFADVTVATAAGETIARALVAARQSPAALFETPVRPLGRAGAAEASGVDPEALARLVSARFSGSPFSSQLRIASARYGEGNVVAVLPWQSALADHDGRVHEGAIATVIDAAGGAAAWAVEGFDARGRASTIAMHLTCGVSTRGEDVIATARPPWRTGEIFAIPVEILGRSSGRPLATGNVTYRILRPTTGA
jgi:acyl-coenzyme A thioesterase PaaI-like protein